jgi:3-phenylpropionate/cinnamic acid dioxygenase small subunit
MHSYYEFENKFFETSKDVSYTNVSTSEVKSMEVNGYQVNYISLSYTYDETENYTEYCAYVMLNDETEFMCSIYARSDDINEDIIKDCFASQIPVTQ